MSKKNFIKGTFILTFAGLLTRLLGFFFKMYLSRLIGAEGIGLYQLIMPVCAISYAVGISGFEVATSRFVAINTSRKQYDKAYYISLLCMVLSLSICIFCCIFIRINADFIAIKLFNNKESAPLIRTIVLSIPFSCIHCIVSSYYIGQEKTGFPAFSQLAEQIIRIGSVFIMVKVTHKTNASTAVLSLVIGEAGAAVISIIAIALARKNKKFNLNMSKNISRIFKMVIPISTNRSTLHSLQSLETVLIPQMLLQSGLSASESLETYGIITGMALPIILFPATLSNSVSLMLLPSVSKCKNDITKLKETGRNALLFSFIFGLFCAILFVTAGAPLGAFCFKEEKVADFVRVMAWLCPFIFLSSTYKSMLNALGKSALVFINNIISESICILFIILLVPTWGIYAYMIGLLTSQIINAFLQIFRYYKFIYKASKSS